jgi:hypothetical protein
MPPRGVYKARQEEKKKQNRSPRPAQESRSDRRQQERQERANAQRALAQAKARRAKEADAKRKQAQADAIIAQRKERVRKARANQARNTMTRSKPVEVKLGMTGNQLGRQIQDPSDIQATIKAGKKFLTQQKQNNAVKSSTVSKMSPPLEKARATSKRGLTITGGKISTYSGGESGPKQKSLIYKDSNTGSTIATKEARTNIAKGGDYNIVASTASTKLGKGIPTPTTEERPDLKGTSPTGMLFSPTTPSISAGQIIGQKPKPQTAGPKGFTKKTPTDFMKQQAQIVDRIDQPSQTKLDLLTGEPVKPTTPTLLSELTKKRKRRQKSGFTGIMAQIRTLLG